MCFLVVVVLRVTEVEKELRERNNGKPFSLLLSKSAHHHAGASLDMVTTVEEEGSVNTRTALPHLSNHNRRGEGSEQLGRQETADVLFRKASQKRLGPTPPRRTTSVKEEQQTPVGFHHNGLDVDMISRVELHKAKVCNTVVCLVGWSIGVFCWSIGVFV